MMIFKAPFPIGEYSIKLPSPSLNDIKRLTISQIAKRNLDHDIITYVKRNQFKQFNWQFLLSVVKMWELFYFMREYKEKKIQVIDHKDKILVGYFINAADSFTHERRGDFPSRIYDAGSNVTEELVSITVDFVGNYQ